MHGHELIIKNLDKIQKFITNGNLIEIGSDRVSGSTKKLADVAHKMCMNFVTVDPDEGAYQRASDILNIYDGFQAVQGLGEDFLKNFGEQIHLLYLDAFDNVLANWPHKDSTIESYLKRGVELTNENAWKMHLDAVQNSYQKIVVDGFICIDDTVYTRRFLGKSEWEGKGKLAVPFLLNNGFKIFKTDRKNCVLLQKK